MRPARAAALLAAALAFPGASAVSAADIPDRPAGWVSDFAGILDAGARERIASDIAAIERKTSVEIAIVTVESLDGRSIEDYAIRLAQKWKVGKQGKDNGVIIIVARRDRKVRIEVGYGLESVLPDGACGEIIRSAITPAFRRGDYAGGIGAAVGAVASRVGGESPGGAAAAPVGAAGGSRAEGALALLGIAAFLAGFGAGGASRGRPWGRYVTGTAIAGWLGAAGLALAAGLRSADAFLWLSVMPGWLGWVSSGARTGSGRGGTGVWWAGGSGGWGGGGGGFSGFGGGSFGGGGASGGW